MKHRSRSTRSGDGGRRQAWRTRRRSGGRERKGVAYLGRRRRLGRGGERRRSGSWLDTERKRHARVHTDNSERSIARPHLCTCFIFTGAGRATDHGATDSVKMQTCPRRLPCVIQECCTVRVIKESLSIFAGLVKLVVCASIRSRRSFQHNFRTTISQRKEEF
jgi:hypothetical protein